VQPRESGVTGVRSSTWPQRGAEPFVLNGTPELSAWNVVVRFIEASLPQHCDVLPPGQ
jgi:hypothetical protein